MHPSRRLVRSTPPGAVGLGFARRVLLGAATVVALNGCTGLADFLTPGQRGDVSAPAMLSLQANIALPQTATADIVTLNVTASYVRRDDSRVRIGTQVMALSSAALQPVPIPIDVGPCLTDPERLGNGASCAVVLNLALRVNGVVVDEQVVGPLQLTPGQPANFPEPVTLFELADVNILDGSGTVLPESTVLALTPGATQSLLAEVRDSRSQLVTDRPVVWSSNAPQVASISSTGVVTAIAEGTARFTATLGALSASVSAEVVRPTVSLAIAGTTTSGTGTVRSTPAGIDCRVSNAGVSGTCSFAFSADAEVTLRSIPDAGNLFTAWGAACAATATTTDCVVTLTEPTIASAQFGALRTISVAASGTADGVGRISGSAGLDCSLAGTSATGTCSVQIVEGSSITLNATPSSSVERQSFAGWDEACAASTGSSCTLTAASSDLAVRAGFFGERRLSLSLDGTGGGTVLGTPSIECTRAASGTSGACEAPYVHGSMVTLTAQPDAQSAFESWSGACSGTDASCEVAMTEARTVSARFVRRQVTLTHTVAGTGAGSVQLDGSAFCSREFSGPDDTCTRAVDAGTEVTLRGVAGVFSAFAGFSGDCDGTAPCALTLNGDRTVRAEFDGVPVGVQMVPSALTSTGSGVVRASAAGGIDCTYTLGVPGGTACQMSVNPLTPVQLTATAAPATALLSWGEACANATTTTCELAPTSAVNVSAQFGAAIDVTLRLEGTTGAGTVSFEVPGVPNQPVCVVARGELKSCRFSLPLGTTGVFRGVAGPGDQFIGFNGPCVEGTGPVPVCTYRGFGFVREIRANFQAP
jgi:hypothetical protein